MAHDEFNKEVSARREAEAKMVELRAQLKEQAAKLGSLDAVQKKEEALSRRSTELKTSLVGMEKELSTLRVRRDIAVAEVEELVKVDKSSSVDLSLSLRRRWPLFFPDILTRAVDTKNSRVHSMHDWKVSGMNTAASSTRWQPRRTP
jgi:predicted  nucleic acid-binding Zn-ribbon protein